MYWSCLMCTGFLDFMGDDFMLVSVFSAGLGSTPDIYGAFEEAHIFSGDVFILVSVFSAELGSTADTSTASVYGAF